MRSRFALLVALATAALHGAGLAAAPPSSDRLAKLGAWVGRWNFSGQIYATPYSQAHVDTGVADCTWSANKGYVICDYFSDNPPHDDLSVMTYDTSKKAYTLSLAHRDRAGSSEEVMQDGNTWISSRAVSDNGKTLVFKTTFVFVTPEKQTTKVQVSADRGRTWTTMIFVTAIKA